MNKKLFGSSGIPLSRMGLGLAALGRPGYINLGHADDLAANYDVEQMQQHTHHMLEKALQLGVSYFDAAQSYGKAEEFLSSWLKTHRDQNVIVGSKWGYYYTADWSVQADKHEIKEHTITRLNKQWPESKSRLSPNLKLYQIHSATFESGVLENQAVLERLEEIRNEGYLIGLSVSGPQQSEVIEQALKVQIGQQPLFGAVQVTFNCLEQSTREVLQKASDQGLGIIVKEGVANGRLTPRNQEPYLDTLKSIGQKHGVGIDTIGLAYILAQPFVNVVLSGAAAEDHLLSNLKAMEIQLSAEDLNSLNQLVMRPKDYWSERSNLAWN